MCLFIIAIIYYQMNISQASKLVLKICSSTSYDYINKSRYSDTEV